MKVFLKILKDALKILWIFVAITVMIISDYLWNIFIIVTVSFLLMFIGCFIVVRILLLLRIIKEPEISIPSPVFSLMMSLMIIVLSCFLYFEQGNLLVTKEGEFIKVIEKQITPYNPLTQQSVRYGGKEEIKFTVYLIKRGDKNIEAFLEVEAVPEKIDVLKMWKIAKKLGENPRSLNSFFKKEIKKELKKIYLEMENSFSFEELYQKSKKELALIGIYLKRIKPITIHIHYQPEEV